MRILPISACNRFASTVDTKAPGDACNVYANVSLVANTRSKFNKEVGAMTRQLVSLIQFIKEAKDRGEDLNALYIDPDDVVEIDEEENSEED